MHNGEKGDDSYIENNDVVKASAPPAYEDSDYGDNVYYTKPAFEDGEYSRMAHLRKITPGAPSVSMPHLGYIIPPEQRTLSAALALFFGVGVWGLILYGSYYVAEFNNNPSAYSVTDADDLLKTLAWGIAVGVVLGSFFTNLARQKELSREAHKFAEANTESKDVSARGALSDKTLEKYSQETRNREYVGHFIGILFLGQIGRAHV